MKQILNRSLALVMALVMCLSILSGVQLPKAEAATVEYRYGSTSQYSDCENVIYNWGNRGTTATFLSPNAEEFYQNNNTSYSVLAALSGSSSISSVPNSALFKQLRSLMTDNHSYITKYDDTRDMYAFTDCQNSGLTSSYISSFYSGANIGPGWDGGKTWNREHTWPNSKGDANGNGENDIMMLRPASSSENSGRGNNAYGESSSFYNPNKMSDNKYDLRGDVARIVLYVYVRWQDTSSSAAVLFGTDGVIESKEVLLKWLQEDPVDTWEMGRNDSVESITGTRNVFVDYPELGFKLFGASVPAGYTSPSNNTGGGSTTQNVTVRFVENGTQTNSYTIPAGQSVSMPANKTTPASGYSFAGWVTATVAETTNKPSKIYGVNEAITAADQTFYALYTRVDSSGTGTGDVFRLHTGAITEGDYLLVSAGGAMSTAVNGSSTRRDVVDVTISDNTIVSPSADLIWHIAPSGSSYTMYNAAAEKYLAGTGAKTAGLAMKATVDDYGKWNITAGDSVVMENVGNQNNGVNYTLRRNANFGFACYVASTGTGISLYKATSGTTYYTTGTKTCEHANTTLTGVVSATCTATGYTGDRICTNCGYTVSTGTVLAMLEHSYSNGTCSVCGAADPDAADPDVPSGAYVKVTSAPANWEGTYLIVYENGTSAMVFNGEDAVNGYVSATISNNTIAGSDALDAVAVTVESMVDGYAIKAGGSYISGTNGSNKLNFGNSQQLNTITLESDYTVKITSNTSVLRFNAASNQMRFRYYKADTYTNQKAICLYKLMEAEEPTVELTHISLNPGNDALGFKAVATDLPEGAELAIRIWVTEDRVITKSLSRDSLALRLKNILAYGGGETTIYAQAVILLDGEEVTASAVANTTMRDAIVAVNENWSNYSSAQQNAVKTLYNKYSSVISAWLGADNNIV